jgi:hypothetical protein
MFLIFGYIHIFIKGASHQLFHIVTGIGSYYLFDSILKLHQSNGYVC